MKNQKKERARKRILENAIALVREEGISNLTIEEVTKRSDIAKGTFYLSFQNKEEMEQEMIGRLSYELIRDVFVEARSHEEAPIDRFIYFLDTLIRHFEQDQFLLRFLSDNLSLGLMNKIDQSLDREEWGKESEKILVTFQEDFGYSSVKEAKAELYLLIELVGRVCRNAILDQYPTSMEEIKPLLYRNVRKMLAV